MGLWKRLLSVPEAETSFAKRGFNNEQPERAAHFEKIGRYFLKGYHAALDAPDQPALNRAIAALPESFFIGFSYEGAAMAQVLRDEMSLLRKKRFNTLNEDETGSRHTYMLYVGAGWAYARLPFVSLEKKIRRHDILLRWLILDGYGFHQAYFHTRKYIHERQAPRLKQPYAKQAFYQGVGRSLWFIECAMPQRIADRIAGFPREYHAALWSGVGLAAVYACNAAVHELEQLRQLSGAHYPHLAQGGVFAAAARHTAGLVHAENETACAVICNLPVEEAAQIAYNCRKEISPQLSSADQYETWRTLIRNVFIKTKPYEPVLEKMAG